MKIHLLPALLLPVLALASCAPALNSPLLQPAKLPTTARTLNARCVPVNKEIAFDMFDRWNAALQTGDPAKVADMYWDNALLLPTVSNRPRVSRPEIEDYFVKFLKKKPSGKIERRIIRLGCNVIVDGGIYTFNFASDGSQVTGRFTYVYEYDGKVWKIASHHSSALPQDIEVEPWSE